MMTIHQDDRRQLECVIADLTKELEAKDKTIKDWERKYNELSDYDKEIKIKGIKEADKEIAELNEKLNKNSLSFNFDGEEFYIEIDKDASKNEVLMFLLSTSLYLASSKSELLTKGDSCDHEFASADNQVVTGAEVCLKCKTIRAKGEG